LAKRGVVLGDFSALLIRWAARAVLVLVALVCLA